MVKLFHSDVFMPAGVQDVVLNLQRKLKDFTLSKHFEEHLNNQDVEDRSHTYLRNAVMNALNEMKSDSRVLRQAFEVELQKSWHSFGVSDWLVTKYCIRIPYDSKCDLVVVIRPKWNKEACNYDVNQNTIVTAWINNKTDAHFTLDDSKYCSEQEWNSLY